MYTRSTRAYPARVPEPEYGSALQVRRTDGTGHFPGRSQHVFLSEDSGRRIVGLLPVDERLVHVYFAPFPDCAI